MYKQYNVALEIVCTLNAGRGVELEEGHSRTAAARLNCVALEAPVKPRFLEFTLNHQ